jgi:hypothetical protein
MKAAFLLALSATGWGLVALLLPHSASAEWAADPRTNLAVCTARGNQERPAIIADGSGGTIIVWEDQRGGSWDIYAQHVLSSGTVDPAWPGDGRVICSAPGDQRGAELVSDGAGGAVVAWEDARSGHANVHAQHVLASGAVDPAWPANGRALGASDDSQGPLTIVADGSGGAIVTWLSSRSGGEEHAIVAQRLLASGGIDTHWPSAGRVLSTVAISKDPYSWWNRRPFGVADGAGGAIVTWQDYRQRSRVFAQHLLASGSAAPDWPEKGFAPSAAEWGDQDTPLILSDGAGGGIIAWSDTRQSVWSVHAQHALARGARDPKWPAEGRAVADAPIADPAERPSKQFPTSAIPVEQFIAGLVSDGAGGAIVAWENDRYNAHDLYAGHVTANGQADPAWPAEGRRLNRTRQVVGKFGAMVADGQGGAFVVWTVASSSVSIGLHGRSFHTDDDVVAQHVVRNGTLDPAWPEEGRVVSSAKHGQLLPQIVADDRGGVIVVWQDERTKDRSSDIYAQRVQSNGELGNTVTRR